MPLVDVVIPLHLQVSDLIHFEEAVNHKAKSS